MELESYIIIGGIYNLGLVIFHLLFWKIFNWKKGLRLLNSVDRNTIQVLNIFLTLVFFIFGYISIFHSSELISTKLGITLLGFFSFFWFLRAIAQIYFYGIKSNFSKILFLVFILGSLLYTYPLLKLV
jgi:hypothetical protein